MDVWCARCAVLGFDLVLVNIHFTMHAEIKARSVEKPLHLPLKGLCVSQVKIIATVFFLWHNGSLSKTPQKEERERKKRSDRSQEAKEMTPSGGLSLINMFLSAVIRSVSRHWGSTVVWRKRQTCCSPRYQPCRKRLNIWSTT